jgi:phosphatidylglycerophosphatase A
MRKSLLLLATFFSVGRIRVAPGTFTSFAVVLLCYFIPWYWPAPLYVKIITIVIVFLLGIPAASIAENHFNKKDPRQCVIDEVAGQLICLLLIPHSISYYLAGFILFRIFDILKPFPVKAAEKIPGGIGIMLDDVVAGLYGLAVLQLYILAATHLL